MSTPHVLSIHIGLPAEHRDGDRPWRTAYFKAAVDQAVAVRTGGIEGDGQALQGAHGGDERAVLAYAASHYPAWREEFPQTAFAYGAFGENLTVEGLCEDDVCIGDRHHLGDVVLEVSQPRSPCGNISIANGIPTLLARVEETSRIGWLYRVIQEGAIAPGQTIRVERGPNPGWSVKRTFSVYKRARRGEADALPGAAEMAEMPRLAAIFRTRMAAAVAKAAATSGT